MTNVKKRTTFVACDGREFDTEAEVLRYETMRRADEQLAEAVRVYNVAMAQVLKTADGYPFKLGDEYFIVWEHAYNEGISQEYLRGREARVYYDGSREPVVLWSGRSGGDNKVTEFYLTDIYKKERNAKLRLIEIRKQRLGWLQDDIARMEKDLGIEPGTAQKGNQ